MEKTFNGLIFKKSSNWLVCLILILTVLQLKVIAPPIDIFRAVAFLGKFGYMRESGSDLSLMSMTSTRKPVLDYQEYMGLDKTGELDNATLTMMSKPRCGVEDKFNDDLTRRKRYVLKELEGSRWVLNEISYSISKYPKRIKDRQMVDREIERAFKVWNYYSDLLIYKKGNDRRGDIDIRFEERHHGDGNSFDGPGFTLAHATPPKRNAFIHFDDEEEWTIDENSGKNLFQVAVHEIGHALGLVHNERDNIMFPNYNETEGPHVALNWADMIGMQMLYGEKILGKSICRRYGDIDAATTTEDGKTYLFKGKYYWEVARGEDSIARLVHKTFPKNISDDWVGLPKAFLPPSYHPLHNPMPPLRGHLDAALTWPNGQTFLFMRDKYWSFRNKVMDPGYPKLISEGFEGIPTNIDAAFMWNNRTFFFKGSNFWEYDCLKTPPVGSEYPQPISNLEGFPDYIDSALQFTDQRTYLFKGSDFYTLNMETFTADPQPSQSRPLIRDWFGCQLDDWFIGG